MDMEYPAGIRRSALLIALLSGFLTPFMASSITLAITNIQNEFSMDSVSVVWIPTAYLLAAAMFLVPFGKIADIHGRRRIYKYGILIDTVASLLCAISFSAPWLVSFRFLQGFGDAMIFGTSTAILVAVYPFSARGKVLGIAVASTYFGLSMGPFLGGMLTQQFGWRSVFIFIMLIDFTIIAILFLGLKGEWTGMKGEKFDWRGSALYGSTLLAVVLGLTLLPFSQAFWLIGAGVAGLFIFIVLESKVKSPVLDMKLFRHNAAFTFSNLAALINYMATAAVTFLMSYYLQDIRGFGEFYAGLILTSQPIMMAIFSPMAGWLSDRVEPRIISSSGMGVIVVGLCLLATLSEITNLPFIVASLMILGFGFALFSSPNTNAVMSSVDRRFYGVASATVGTMRLVGQTLSYGITMLVFALIIGKVEMAPEYYPLLMESTRLLFIIFAILCFIGIFASLARGKIQGRNQTSETSLVKPSKKRAD